MGRRRQRVRLEDGLKLDLNRLIRQKSVRPGGTSGAKIRWSDRHSDEEIAVGSIVADMRADVIGAILLTVGDCSQRIVLQCRPRHFGGGQWYFVCPRSRLWASVLWKPPGSPIFACRHSWGRQVAYGSQFQTPHDRALSAAQDIRYRLAGKDDISLVDSKPPPRPKGMHCRTYERAVRRCESYETLSINTL
jgi:hypothetical protein